MKHIVLCFWLFSAAISGAQGQSKKELANSLTHDLEAYRGYALQMNFDSMFLFMPQAMFEIIPRDSIISVMSRSIVNDNFTIEMTGFHYKGKPKIRKAGKYHWAFVEHEGQMTFRFKKDDSMNKLMMTMMKSQFGSDNVREEDAKTLAITLKDKRLIAYKDPALSMWSLVEDKRTEGGKEGEMQKVIYQAVVPEEVRKAVGSKKR